MFNYKKFSLPIIFTTFFSYSTNETELPCANSRYSQCLNCFSYLLPAVIRKSPIWCWFQNHPTFVPGHRVHLSCIFHASLMHLQCIFNASSMYPQCIFTISSMHFKYIFNAFLIHL